MPNTTTTFDINKHHIHIEFYVTDPKGVKRAVDGVIDTGAPRTEFSDEFLDYAGFITIANQEIKMKHGLQTQKYGKLVIPEMKICGYSLRNFEVFISRFDESWGIDALVGLDFFHRFRVTIDYKVGHLITEPL